MTDHVGAAKILLGHLENEDMEALAALGVVGVAQVHATLALVEEQRTANLLAFLNVVEGQIPPDEIRRSVDDLRDRLGLA